jgi:protein-tyrosine phosphatase
MKRELLIGSMAISLLLVAGRAHAIEATAPAHATAIEAALAKDRVIPLEQGSNFRDIGGYQTVDGKHVRWGMIYRSGAMPMLTDADVTRIEALGIKDVVDLRSNEERKLAPTRLKSPRIASVDYSLMAMMADSKGGFQRNGAALYHGFPAFLAPQLKLVFARLLKNDGAVAYNCSAGQDRTGFTTAMVLSALGVPRETIIKDYLLSTELRRPQYEMPHIDEATAKADPVAGLFARYQDDPRAAKPQPLVEADGTPFLAGAFAEIDAKWGGVEQYLKAVIGLSDADLAGLKLLYLE